jgi:hypothetical protein
MLISKVKTGKMVTPKDLQQKVQQLEGRLELIENFCQIVGPWITPEQAAKLTPLSRRRCMSEITIAEQRRHLNKKHDLVYGVHYWNSLFPFDVVPNSQSIQDNGKARNTWKVHYKLFWEVVSKPLEERSIEGIAS